MPPSAVWPIELQHGDEGKDANEPYDENDGQNHALWQIFVNGQNHAIWHTTVEHDKLIWLVMNNMQHSWLLLDSGSTCSLVCNKDLVCNIFTMDHDIKIKGNARQKVISQQSFLAHDDNYAWNCPDGFANILVLSHLCRYFQCHLTTLKWKSRLNSLSEKSLSNRGGGLFYHDTKTEGKLIFPQLMPTLHRPTRDSPKRRLRWHHPAPGHAQLSFQCRHWKHGAFQFH